MSDGGGGGGRIDRLGVSFDDDDHGCGVIVRLVSRVVGSFEV